MLYCLTLELGRSREDVVSLQSIRWIVRTKNLPLLPLPLWLVDGIDVILNFHHDATILLNYCGTAIDALGRLDGKRA